jgi:hypothetical protein
MHFHDPLHLSYEVRDQLSIKFKDPLLFVSESGLAIDLTSQIQTRAIPRQNPIDE